ncbi:MAG: family 20 glycosylhydrolase [Fibrobacteres bacterium]|nr:family 20 glycosylhydrolase [Fibrobacterota bacterium]
MTKFKERIFHLDLRIQVMTPKALSDLADHLVKMKFTTLVIEWEATFPFKKHPVLANRFVYTRKEVVEFLDYCKSIGLKTLAIQACFGHVEYILQHDRYAHLREDERDICQICPLKINEALPLIKDLFTELLEMHNSEYCYIGCDETYILGSCPACREKAAKSSKSQLYVDYLVEVVKLAKSFGKRPVIPADMLLQYPEAARELPNDTVLVDWNYGWEPGSKFGPPEPLFALGFEFWGSLSLRSGPDNYYLHTFEKHLKNYHDFIPYAKEKGYSSVVLTSFSTSGIYGFEWDAFYETVMMHPVRRVYPLNGFNILMAAFVKACDSNEPLDYQQFIVDYAIRRFAISESEAKLFKDSLLADASPVYKPKVEFYQPPAKVLASVSQAVNAMNAIIPHKNRREFGHFRLMFAIRETYLKFKLIEETTEVDSFGDAERIRAIAGLEEVLAEEKVHAKTYKAYMRGYLHPAEIKTENSWRIRKPLLLIERLSRER